MPLIIPIQPIQYTQYTEIYIRSDMDLPSYDIVTSVFAIHLWICWESINSINAARAICIFAPELESLSIMGLGLLLVFVWHRWLQFISSSPHLYVEKLRIYQLIASYLHFCSRASAFVWHWCSQFISHMLRIYQLRASYLHFSSRAWGWVAWVAITDADVPMCHCVCVFVLFVLI